MAVADASDVRALALAVIDRAIADAKSGTAEERDAALAFLTDTKGPNAMAFDAWACLAGVTPEWARERIAENKGRPRPRLIPRMAVRYAPRKRRCCIMETGG